MLPDDYKRIFKLLRGMGRWVQPETDDLGFVVRIRFTSRYATESLRKLAALGFSFEGIAATEWTPRIFLTTSIMSAYEVAYEFSVDRHHAGPFSVIAIHRRHLSDELSPDTHIHFHTTDRGRRQRKQRGSVMTYNAIPPSAIAFEKNLPADLLKMANFRRWIGVKTYGRGRK
jgi:hypothetical protein